MTADWKQPSCDCICFQSVPWRALLLRSIHLHVAMVIVRRWTWLMKPAVSSSHLFLVVWLRWWQTVMERVISWGNGASVIFLGEVLWIFTWWYQVDNWMCHSGCLGGDPPAMGALKAISQGLNLKWVYVSGGRYQTLRTWLREEDLPGIGTACLCGGGAKWRKRMSQESYICLFTSEFICEVQTE